MPGEQYLYRFHKKHNLTRLARDILEKAKNKTISWYDIVGYYKIEEDILIEFKDNIPFYYLVQFQDMYGYREEIQLLILYEVFKECKERGPSVYFRNEHFTRYMREKFEILNMLS